MAGFLRFSYPRGRRLYVFVASLLLLYSIILLGNRSRSVYHNKHLEKKNLNDIERIENESNLNITWLIQVSDIHIQDLKDVKSSLFESFVEKTVSVIKPALVLVTGDITNGKYQGGLVLQQKAEEWLLYEKFLKKRDKSIPWLDIAGNHDTFDEEGHAHFKIHGIQSAFGSSRTAMGTRITSHQANGQNLTLLPVDGSLNLGLRTYNFLGYVNWEEMNQLDGATKDAHSRGDVVIFYGHYPTSALIAPPDLRQLLATGAAYFCGHLHTFFGWAPTMWATHTNGLLEVELGDWYTRKRFRIIGVDNGKVSWMDAHATVPDSADSDIVSWPILLVTSTNQKENKEDSNKKDIKVRFLLFDKEPIVSVHAWIGDESWTQCIHVDGPIYVCSLSPNNYLRYTADILRNMHIEVTKSSGKKVVMSSSSTNTGFVHQPATLFGTFLLMIKMPNLLFLIILTIMSCCCCLLYAGTRPDLFRIFPQKLLDSVIGISKDRKNLYSLLIFLLYPVIGPWYIGRLSGSQRGTVFFWGIFVGEETLPGELTYPSMLLLLITLQLPFFTLVCLRESVGYNNSEYLKKLHMIFFSIVGVQVIPVVAYIILDSIVLEGPLRLLLTIVAATIWRGNSRQGCKSMSILEG